MDAITSALAGAGSGVWRRRAFQFAVFACGQFLILTVLAMFLYPGGTASDSTTAGYQFFSNFFSDLGRTVSHSGVANTASAALFVVALTIAGLGLAAFFLAAPGLFHAKRWPRWLSRAGSLAGVVVGLSFVGVAWTPADVFTDAHIFSVLAAFRLFPLVVIGYALAIFLMPGYPRRYGAVYVAFAALLIAYLLLLTRGPGLATAESVTIQATGQKIIVYATVLCMAIQGSGALHVARSGRAVSS